MHITMTIGEKTVEISNEYNEHETDNTWGYILSELVWPALRGFGYVIDETWTESLPDEHAEYIAQSIWNRK